MDEPRRRRKSVTSISSDCQDDVVEDELLLCSWRFEVGPEASRIGGY